MADKPKFVIIGVGPAGKTAVSKLVAMGHEAEIITVGDAKKNPEKLLSADVVINEDSIPLLKEPKISELIKPVEIKNDFKHKSKFHK